MSPFQQRTEIDGLILRMAREGVFLRVLRREMAECGYRLSEHDEEFFQNEILLVASSLRRPFTEKINVIEKLVADAVGAVGKIGEFLSSDISQSSNFGGTPCLTCEKIRRVKPGQVRFRTRGQKSPEKNPLGENSPWTFKGRDGRPLARLAKEGGRVVLYAFGGARLGWYDPRVTPDGTTYNVKGEVVGRGNMLVTLIQSS